MASKNEWLAQQLRISVFPAIDTFDPLKNLWPQIEGAEIENETKDRKTEANTYEGSFRGHKLVLSVTPIKIDLIVTVNLSSPY